ncbi:hypothetical protein [Oceanicola sp. S124]|uniref:hypothetical protein n=1 Tax=Oceanicola sp. S124 TaxID=1042378 RepID=UPI0002E4F27D|nr:hypothetical protein [Oceanicola sp. S124]
MPAALSRWPLSIFVWLVLVFLVVPVTTFLPMAFRSASFLEFPPTSFSLKWFEAYLNSPSGPARRSARR